MKLFSEGDWSTPVYPVDPSVPADQVEFETRELWPGNKVRIRPAVIGYRGALEGEVNG